MRIEIIDMRSDRRMAIEKWLKDVGHEVNSSPNNAGMTRINSQEWPSLLLLHVGADQDTREVAPSSVGMILREYAPQCWVLGYFGGAACRDAVSFEHKNVCLVETPIRGLDDTLKDAIRLVLQESEKPEHKTLAEFGKVINDFDFVLEAKLKLLSGLLGGGDWKVDARYLTGKGISVAKQSADIAEMPQLLDRVAAIGELHRRLFPHRRLR